MDEYVYMNLPAVRQISKTSEQIAQFLDKVNKIMDGLSRVLKAQAFMGMVGGLAFAQYMDSISVLIKKTSEECFELSRDVAFAADAYERGDAQGASRFY